MMLERTPEGIIPAEYREAMHDLIWEGEVREWDKKGRLKPRRIGLPSQQTTSGRASALAELAALNAQIADLQAASQPEQTTSE